MFTLVEYPFVTNTFVRKRMILLSSVEQVILLCCKVFQVSIYERVDVVSRFCFNNTPHRNHCGEHILNMNAELILLTIGGLLFWYFGKRNAIAKKTPTFAIVLGVILSLIALLVGVGAIYFYIESVNYKNELDIYDQMFGYDPYKSTYYSLLLLASIFIFLSIYFFCFKKSTGGSGTKTRKVIGYLYLLIILTPSLYNSIGKIPYMKTEEMIITIVVLIVLTIPAIFLCMTYPYEKRLLRQFNEGTQQKTVTTTANNDINHSLLNSKAEEYIIFTNQRSSQRKD